MLSAWYNYSDSVRFFKKYKRGAYKVIPKCFSNKLYKKSIVHTSLKRKTPLLCQTFNAGNPALPRDLTILAPAKNVESAELLLAIKLKLY